MEIEEEDEQVAARENRGSLSFFDEDESNQDATNQTNTAKLMDDIKVFVLKCDKEGNDYCYLIKVGVWLFATIYVTCFNDLSFMHRLLLMARKEK